MRNSKKNYYIILSLVLLFCSSCKTSLMANQSVNFRESDKIAQAKESSIKGHSFPALAGRGLRVTAFRGQMLPITAIAIIKETVINLEVAKTTEEQSMGLMFREALPDDRGMFFPFEEARITRFWMNNVPVPLDMIFVKENKVIAIADSVPPCTTKPEDCPLYGPDIPVDGVIELRAGRAKSLDLGVGDVVKIKYLNISQ